MAAREREPHYRLALGQWPSWALPGWTVLFITPGVSAQRTFSHQAPPSLQGARAQIASPRQLAPSIEDMVRGPIGEGLRRGLRGRPQQRREYNHVDHEEAQHPVAFAEIVHHQPLRVGAHRAASPAAGVQRPSPGVSGSCTPIHRRPTNSSTVSPASRMIARSVPLATSR